MIYHLYLSVSSVSNLPSCAVVVDSNWSSSSLLILISSLFFDIFDLFIAWSVCKAPLIIEDIFYYLIWHRFSLYMPVWLMLIIYIYIYIIWEENFFSDKCFCLKSVSKLPLSKQKGWSSFLIHLFIFFHVFFCIYYIYNNFYPIRNGRIRWHHLCTTMQLFNHSVALRLCSDCVYMYPTRQQRLFVYMNIFVFIIYIPIFTLKRIGVSCIKVWRVFGASHSWYPPLGEQ
jgi:hypothetical protein